MFLEKSSPIESDGNEFSEFDDINKNLIPEIG